MANLVGANNRYVVAVDETNKLQARSVATTVAVDAIKRGDGFAIITPEITLTSDTPSALLVYTNDNDKDIVIFNNSINLSDAANSTDATAQVILDLGIGLEMIGGTGNPVNEINLIIGRPVQVTSISEAGQEGASIPGSSGVTRYVDVARSADFDVFGVIPKGSSIAITVTPPPGNTSMMVSVVLDAYLVTEYDQ